MFPLFTLSIIIFIVLALLRRKSTNVQQTAEQAFWDKENTANAARRKDLNELTYITIPLDLFPLDLGTENEDNLRALANERIFNLHGMSNTDLKMEYGAANLEDLTQYETNFYTMQETIASYAKELVDAERFEEAMGFLEFAVSQEADVPGIYLQLAELYQAMGEPESIDTLIGIVEKWESLTKNALLGKLQAMRNPEPVDSDDATDTFGSVASDDDSSASYENQTSDDFTV